MVYKTQKNKQTKSNKHDAKILIHLTKDFMSFIKHTRVLEQTGRDTRETVLRRELYKFSKERENQGEWSGNVIVCKPLLNPLKLV